MYAISDTQGYKIRSKRSTLEKQPARYLSPSDPPRSAPARLIPALPPTIPLRFRYPQSISYTLSSASRLVQARSAGSSTPACEQKLLLIELDGVVVDIHTDGHRVAFNQAFKSFGVECASWSPPVYNDLQRVGDGTAESMLTRYFDAIEWPLTVPTGERGTFVRKIHEKQRSALQQLLKQDGVPLRAGIESVIDSALASGVQVALLSGTSSTAEHDVASSVGRKLGEERTKSIKLFAVPQGGGMEEEDDGDSVGSLEGALKSAATQMKNSQAQSFVQMVASGGSSKMASIGVDPSLLAGGQAPHKASAAWMSAVCTTLGVSPSCSVLLAANNSLLQAASDAGMLAIAIPRKFNYSGSFPAAAAKFGDMGPGGATWEKLSAMVDRRK